MGLVDEYYTQVIDETLGWNPFGFLADNALIIAVFVIIGLMLVIKFIGAPRRLGR